MDQRIRLIEEIRKRILDLADKARTSDDRDYYAGGEDALAYLLDWVENEI